MMYRHHIYTSAGHTETVPAPQILYIISVSSVHIAIVAIITHLGMCHNIANVGQVFDDVSFSTQVFA